MENKISDQENKEQITFLVASRTKRLLAYIIDIIPITLVVVLIGYQFFGLDAFIASYSGETDAITPEIAKKVNQQSNLLSFTAFVIWILYSMLMEGLTRKGTLGKQLMNIRVVDDKGESPDMGKAITRNVCKIFSYFPLQMGFIWILFDEKRQGWHDKLMRTYVVEGWED